MSWDQLKADAEFLGQYGSYLVQRDQDFARSLLEQFHDRGLSAKQEYWVGELAGRARKAKAQYDAHQEVKTVAAKPVVDLTRIVELFKTASTNLRKPYMLVTEGDWKLRLSLAGKSSKYAGQVYVHTAGPYEDRLWLGRVDPATKTFSPSRDLSTGGQTSVDEIECILVALAADPTGTATRYGRTVGHCCFCSRQLNDPRSVTVGYGPICADHFGLPWGEVVEVQDFKSEPNEPQREFEYAGFWYGEIDGRLQPCPGQHAAAAKERHVRAARDEFEALRARKKVLDKRAYETRPGFKMGDNNGVPFDDEIPF